MFVCAIHLSSLGNAGCPLFTIFVHPVVGSNGDFWNRVNISTEISITYQMCADVKLIHYMILWKQIEGNSMLLSERWTKQIFLKLERCKKRSSNDNISAYNRLQKLFQETNGWTKENAWRMSNRISHPVFSEWFFIHFAVRATNKLWEINVFSIPRKPKHRRASKSFFTEINLRRMQIMLKYSMIVRL